MTATLTDVAEAIKSDLNAATWSVPFTAVRARQVQYTLTDLATIKVPVVEASTTTEPLTRGKNLKSLGVDVGVVVKLSDVANATVDPYVALVDEIADYFDRRRLAAMSDAMCLVTRPEPIFDMEKLEQQRVFFAVLRLEVQVEVPA